MRSDARAGVGGRRSCSARCWAMIKSSDPRLDKSGSAAGEVSEGADDAIVESAEECLLATLEAALARLSQAVAAAAAREQLWLERVRAGLVALLGFLDDEPRRGRLLVFVSASDRAPSDAYEQRVLGVLAGLLLDESPQASAEPVSSRS